MSCLKVKTHCLCNIFIFLTNLIPRKIKFIMHSPFIALCDLKTSLKKHFCVEFTKLKRDREQSLKNIYFKIYFIDYIIPAVPFFFSLYSPLPCTAPPTSIPPLSSCPWVIHINSLASPFPILFLTFPCLFCTYHLCFLFPVPLPSFFPLLLPIPADNAPCDLHFCDSVPVPVVCLVLFCFVFRFSW